MRRCLSRPAVLLAATSRVRPAFFVAAAHARRTYLPGTVFSFDEADRQRVADLLQSRLATVTTMGSSTAQGSTSTSAVSVQVCPVDATASPALIDADAGVLSDAVGLAREWQQSPPPSQATAPAKTASKSPEDSNGNASLSSTKTSGSALAIDARRAAEEAYHALRTWLPAEYRQHLDDVRDGAAAKKSGERLQEALLRKMAARCDIDAADARVAAARQRVEQHRLEEPCDRQGRPALSNPAYAAWDAEHAALKNALRRAEAERVVVEVGALVQEEKLERDTRKSGAYLLAVWAARNFWTALSVILLGFAQFVAYVFWFIRWLRGTSTRQRLTAIETKLDSVIAGNNNNVEARVDDGRVHEKPEETSPRAVTADAAILERLDALAAKIEEQKSRPAQHAVDDGTPRSSNQPARGGVVAPSDPPLRAALAALAAAMRDVARALWGAIFSPPPSLVQTGSLAR